MVSHVITVTTYLLGYVPKLSQWLIPISNTD